MRKFCFFILTGCLLNLTTFAQVTVTNPTNTTPVLAATYGSLAAAVTALSAITAINGPVVITLNAGNPETAPAGGYVIQFTATTTAANNIIISGSNNTITAFTPQTVGNLNDAIFKIIGADYITIQNFTMQENAGNTVLTPSGSNTMTEWGVALIRATTTDGAQNNTIQNNTISMNIAYRNSFGIYSNARHTPTNVTATSDATALSGSNSGNKVYGNNISNTMMGITFIGTATAAFQDVGNDIGGSSVSTGNTITNWGGNTPLTTYASNSGTSYCIYSNHQTADNISYNTITSGNVGAGVSTTFSGIRKDYTTTAPTGTFTTTISYNTITMTSSFTGGNFDGIRNLGMTSLSTATINITNNNIINSAITAASTSAFGGIINASAPGTLNITNNIIRGHTTMSSGGYTGISNSGAVVNTINITNNKIGDAVAPALTQTTASVSQLNAITNSNAGAAATINLNNNSIDGFSVVTYGQITFVLNNTANGAAFNMNNNMLGSATGNLITFSGAQTSTMFAIINNNGTSAATLSILNNDIQGIVHSVAGSNQEYYITSNVALLSQTMSNNRFINISTNTTNNVHMILRSGNLASGATSTCNNNSVVTGFSKTGAGGTLYGYISSTGSVNGSTMTETGNNFSNISVTGAATLTLWDNQDGVSVTNGPTKIITGNTFNNITGGSNGVNIFKLGRGAATDCSNNTLTNITATGDITGISNNSQDGQGTVNYSNNTMSNFSSTGTGGNVYGISGLFPFVPTTNINGNSFTGFSSTGANASVVGISAFNNGTTTNIYDNLINNFTGTGTGTPFMYGIIVSGSGVGVNTYRNKIHTLTQSGVNSGASVFGIYINGGTNTVHNNFIANLNAANTNAVNAVYGIGLLSSAIVTSYNLYYNSIYLNASSTGTNFGTSGIYHLSNATATTGALTMANNIIVNTSTANGTGLTAAFQRSSTTLTNFVSSDNNLFYAGTPSITNLIFNDGTNNDQTLASYQTRVNPKDANSITAMPSFTSSTDLHLTTANCYIDGRGTPIAITTDIDNATRDITTPDMGADEFSATYGPTLAGVAATAVCDNRTISTSGTYYAANSCDLIARVIPSGADPVAGKINVCVTLDATQLYFNAEPYVQRHFDLEPVTSNQTTTSATVTMYFTNAEFVLYNTNNPVWPPMPTIAGGGNGDPNIANVKVTQFHGTPTGGLPTSTPGNYTGTRVLLTPTSVVLTGSVWAVTVNIAGFSGFYVHSNNYNTPLPIVVNYLNGHKQAGKHLLDWKVTCVSTPRATMTIERSSDGRNYSDIYTITADAARCNLPFDYTDANPLNGMNYYRLKTVDADGRITYSTTVALLNASKGFDIISIAPNPVVNDHFKLNVTSANASKMDITIIDMQGRLVNRQNVSVIAGFNSLDINIANLASGTYTIYGRIEDDRSRLIRFVKQ